MWVVLPGGMPYVLMKEQEFRTPEVIVDKPHNL
jgi:hypothetical protein